MGVAPDARCTNRVNFFHNVCGITAAGFALFQMRLQLTNSVFDVGDTFFSESLFRPDKFSQDTADALFKSKSTTMLFGSMRTHGEVQFL